MSHINFKINPLLTPEIEKAIEKSLEVVMIEVESRAKNNCPVITGDLRQSITRKTEYHKGIVYTNLIYARAVEFGSKAYTITGNPYLTFKTKSGNWVKVKSVKHPKTKGQYFLRLALFQNYKGLINIFQRVMKGFL